MRTDGQVIDRLARVVARVADERDEDEPTMDRCECFWTMGAKKHECVFCEARAVLEELGVSPR